jgi:hypothetical protein
MPYQRLVAPTEVSSDQVTPELVDVKIFPVYTTAASFVPSDDMVMSSQRFWALREVSSVQVTPELIEIQIFPEVRLAVDDFLETAASFVPSDDMVMAIQNFPLPTEVISRHVSTVGTMF